MRSEPGKGSPPAGAASGAHDDLGGRSSGPSVRPHPIPAAAPRAAAGPRAARSRQRSVPSTSDGEALAPVASQPSTSGVAVHTSSSGEEINEVRRQMRSLIHEIQVLEEKSLHSGTPLERVRDELDQLANAGAELLQCYASLPPHLAHRTLSDADVRQYRADVLHRADSANDLAQTIFEEEKKKQKRVEEILYNLVKSNATLDQLSRSVPSATKYHVARTEFWDKKVQRHELMRSVCAATANLPSSTAEMRQEEQAALRLHSGWVANAKVMQLESRTALAQVSMAPQAIMFEAPVRQILVGEDGQTRLMGNFIGDVFPAFLSTSGAVLHERGRPLDPEHCAVLEGVVERLAEFASASHAVVARLRDYQAGAGLPLELLSRIVDDAWITADEVIHLLELQPKPPATALPAVAGAAIPAENAGKTTVGETTTASGKKGKRKSKRTVGASSSAAGGPEPQVAAAVSDPAPEAKVLVRSELGTKKLVSPKEAQNSASSVAARLAVLQITTGEDTKSLIARSKELLKFDLPAQQSLVSRAHYTKPEDAEYTIGAAVQRLQTQAEGMEACLSALEASLRSKLHEGKTAEVHDQTVQLKDMLSKVRGFAKAWDEQKPAITIDCMKRYSFPSQNYLEHLRTAGELTALGQPRALPGDPSNLFEIRLQPKALRNRTMPSPMWVHIHTTRPVYAQQLATLDTTEFAACHVKSNEQRGHNRQWQDARAREGYDNVVIHRGKLTPAFCKSLLTDRADMRNGPA
ncbi:hypothetical protein [Mesorhizobium onobrychidis]